MRHLLPNVPPLTALLLATASPAMAAPSLPPEAAVIAALDAFPGVTAARARIDAARAGATMLARGTHEVTLSGSYMTRDVTSERRYTEFDGTISRAFRLPGKAALDRQAGALGVEVAENRMEDIRHQAALLLSQLWFDWLQAAELYRTDLANAELLSRALSAIQRRASLRDAAVLEVEQARAAFEQAQAMAASSLADREQARAVLAATFPDLPIPQEAPGLGTPERTTLPLEQLRDLVVARSHEIRAADREAARLEALAQRSRKDRMADPTFGFRAFSERNGMERGAGLVLSIPLGGGYRKAAAEQAGAEASAGQLDLQLVRRSVEAMAHGDLVAARDRMVAWQSLANAARSSSAAADRTARGQDLGAIDLADVLLSRRLAREAERNEIGARTAAIRALMKLQIDAHVIWMPAGDEE